MQELVDYLTVEPDAECSKDRGHKFPFLALQLFSDGGDGVTEIVEKFFYSFHQVKTKSSTQPTDIESPKIDQQNFLDNQQDSDQKKDADTMNLLEFHDLMNASPQKMHEDDRSPLEPLEDNEAVAGDGLKAETALDPEDDTEQDQEDLANIFKNIENVVGILNESENKAQQQPEQKPDSDRNEPGGVEGERDPIANAIQIAKAEEDDDSMEFAFEDAIDQQLEDEAETKGTDAQNDKVTPLSSQNNQEQFNFDQIIEKIENPNNVKKSFELRYQNDDDDDIFIVHDGEDEGEGHQNVADQDDLFMDAPNLNFNIIDEDAKEGNEEPTSPNNRKSSSEDFEKIEFSPNDFQDAADKELEVNASPDFNPFTDNLANSEAMPVTQKLEKVMIEDNYLGSPEKGQAEDSNTMSQKLAPFQKKNPNDMLSQSVKLPTEDQETTSLISPQKEDDAQISRTMHQQNLKKRKQKKSMNLSIHQFDEATQKSIKDAVMQNLQDKDDPLDNKTSSDDNTATKGTQKQSLKPVVFEIVEDHIKGSCTGQQNLSNDNEASPDSKEDEFNDREEQIDVDMQIQVQPIESNDNGEGAHEEEEDNILRKQTNNLKIDAQNDINSDEDKVKSPTSPISPGILQSSKFKEQESIELDSSSVSQKIEKQQDYSLIDRFFSFLDGQTNSQGERVPLNSTLSGYFCKVSLIIISQQPKELLKYIEQNDYKLIDKLLTFIDDKSICELISKFLEEILKQLINRQDGNPTWNQENLAKSVANMQDPDNNLLQQSGQSSEAIDKEQKKEEMLGRAKAMIYTILSDKMGEDNDFLEKMGALEVLLDLLKNKICYQVLTTKHSFQIMTRILVSDNDDSKKNVYILLKNLIQNYEKHERFEKRINIDNFDDEELMNSHSGSGSGILNRSKKSKNSRRQNQDVLKDIQESDLFQFIRVVVQEITSSEIETRFDQIVEAKQSQRPLPLGFYFVALIEFLEKASSVFTGFINDINQTLVDKDVFNFIFEILEYYSNSDILNKTVSSLVLNIMRSKSEDTPEMLNYLLEDTKLVPFLISNGPRCIQIEIKQLNNNISGSGSFTAKQNNNDQSGGSGIDDAPSSPKKTKESEDSAGSKEDQGESKQKSPEQSSQIIEEVKPAETTAELAKRFKVQVPSKNSKALQAHVKQISDVLVELSSVQMSTEKSGSLAKSGPEASRGANQSQSGEQSKSSEIIIEDEDQLLQQNMSKVVSKNLNDNSEWQAYVRNQIEPITRLQKGKLCEEKNNSTSGFMNSDNQIFDDDFMRSNSDDDKVNPEALQKLSNEFDNIISSIDNNKSRNNEKQKLDEDDEDDEDDDDVDQKKFFKKMSECLSTNLNKKIRFDRNTNIIDTHERAMKQQAFHSMEAELSNNLRASLTDQNDEQDEFNREDPVSLQLGGRERSASNEFSLPPLQDFDDHRDLTNLDDQNYNNLMSQYKSNEKIDRLTVGHDLSAIATFDDQEDYSPHDRKAITHLADDLALDDVDINLDDSDEMDNANNRDGKLISIENDLKNFDAFANSLDQAIGNNNVIPQNKENMEIGIKTNKNELDDIKNIFEKIDEFDNIFGTNSPDAFSPEAGDEDNEAFEQNNRGSLQLPRSQEVPMNRNSFGMSKSDVIVQMNNLMDSAGDDNNSDDGQDLFGAVSSPLKDEFQMAKEQDDDVDFNLRDDNQIIEKPKEPTSPAEDNIVVAAQIPAANAWKPTKKLKSKKFKQEKEYTMVHNVFATQKSLSKSVYVPAKSQKLLDDEETKVEYLDNNFWNIDDLRSSKYNLDDLLDDIMQGEMPLK